MSSTRPAFAPQPEHGTLTPFKSRPATSATAETDPIFTAIEQHTSAYRTSQKALRVRVEMVEFEGRKGYDAVKLKANDDAYVAALKVTNDAAYELTTVQPTTLAGVLALVRHVDAFNTGDFFLEPENPGETAGTYKSSPIHWPESDGEDGLVDVFGHRVIANVRRALEALAVQS